ncbi:poly(A)-specific ribonuclease PNLDC1-like, partial [Ruditapes philippinarum]|uniref:poly(A)-specific ribonuclease PNLDC1-like n=1 Tax=Ruditapes philippinarum TaxID=129788 RepID=UPI00295A7CAC
MVEVLKSTFNEQYPTIVEDVKHCDFIALDTEFTGLKINEQLKSKLFDDGAERYQNLRKTITQITICQLGLSIFSKVSDENRYEAKTYNFYLYPPTFGPVDERFVCQFIYEGVSYMNGKQEEDIRDHMASKAMFAGLERNLDEKNIEQICSKVAKWFVDEEDIKVMVLEKQ